MDCIAEKYTLGGKYLFFCYHVADELAALPAAERLFAEGVRLWYGECDGSGEAAERLENCSACLFLLSPDALEEHSFVNKITYALCNAKDILFIFARPCALTAGLMLQLDAGRVLGRRDGEMYARLLSDDGVRACSSGRRDPAALELWSRRRLMFEQLEREELGDPDGGREAAEEQSKAQLIFGSGPAAEEQSEDGGSETVWETRCEEDAQVILRSATGEIFPLNGQMNVIGRYDKGAKEPPDIALTNAASVSRRHAAIVRQDGECFLTDLSSRFGTYADGRRLESGERLELRSGAAFRLAGEEFRFFSRRAEAESFMRPPEPEIVETPEAPAEQEIAKKPEVAAEPEIVEKPEVAAEPEIVEKPEAPAEPEIVETPEAPAEPEIVEMPEAPAVPEIVETPEAPAEPEIVETPEAPAEPENAEKPEVAAAQEPPEEEEKPEAAGEAFDGDPIDEMTVRVKRRPEAPDGAEDLSAAQPNGALILRPRTGEGFATSRIETVIGRRSERRPADIMFDGNGEISREHAVIYRYGDRFLVRDSGSLSGTFVDGRRVGSERAEVIGSGSVLRLAREEMLFFCGPELESLRPGDRLCTLESLKSGETRLLAGELRLDRRHEWNDGLLRQDTVSRNHAVVYRFGGRWTVADTGSSNGTFVNGAKLEKGPASHRGPGRVLNDGDVIGIYDLEFRFREYTIR